MPVGSPASEADGTTAWDYRRAHALLGVRGGDLEWLVDQPDPGASAPLDGSVTVLVNPERIHLIPAADAG